MASAVVEARARRTCACRHRPWSKSDQPSAGVAVALVSDARRGEILVECSITPPAMTRAVVNDLCVRNAPQRPAYARMPTRVCPQMRAHGCPHMRNVPHMRTAARACAKCVCIPSSPRKCAPVGSHTKCAAGMAQQMAAFALSAARVYIVLCICNSKKARMQFPCNI